MTLYNVITGVGLLLVAIVVLDRLYQRFSHRLTNEPPMLPYRIPFVGHALMYGNNVYGLYKYAEATFPNCQPYSLMFFGKRVYVFPNPKDVSAIYRNPKSLPFLPLIESLSGLAWGISDEGMKLLCKINPETDESVFLNAHAFYRDALKPGPQLDTLTLTFLRYLNEALDGFDGANKMSAKQTGVRVESLYTWSRTILGTSSTNAMMGPTLLRDNPDLLPSVWIVEQGFFFYVNKVPRLFAKRLYEGRDHAIGAFDAYFARPEEEREGCVPMIGKRERELRQAGLVNRDVAAYSYSAYAALLNNANPASYHFIRHVYLRPHYLQRLREEVAPAFIATPDQRIVSLDQLNHLVNSCPLLHAFYNETLRMHSLTASNRKVVEETVVGGHTLKAGRNVILPPYIQHNKEEYFGQQTDVFNPERFLPAAEDKKAVGNLKMVRAFGGGVSLCSGRHFAGREVLSYVASVIWRYDIDLNRDGAIWIERRS